MRVRARFAAAKVSTASPIATGMPQAAAISRTSGDCRARPIAAGIASTAPSPSRSATEARWLDALLLLVGSTNGCGWNRAADHAGHGDQGQDVRQGLEQRRRRVRVHG